MNSAKTVILVLMSMALAWILFGASAPSSLRTKTKNDACRQFDIDVCRVSYYELIAKADELSGEKVFFTGYLGVDNWTLVLYPSRQAYMLDDDSSSIEVFSSNDILDGIKKDRLSKYVRLSGEFTVHRYDIKDNRRPMRLGYLSISNMPMPIDDRTMDRSNIEVGFRVKIKPD
jgi:hypothetical protein